jgi:hypothetical protein
VAKLEEWVTYLGRLVAKLDVDLEIGDLVRGLVGGKLNGMGGKVRGISGLVRKMRD